LGLEQGLEGFAVEQFAAELAVEGLDERVLPGVPGFDVAVGRGRKAAPVPEGVGGGLGAVSIRRCFGVRPKVATIRSKTDTV